MKPTAFHYQALRKIIGCCLLLLAVQASQAQTRGTVEVIKDPRIDTLAARRLEAARGGGNAAYNPANGAPAISTQGYRVQFFFGSSRAEAYAAQAKMQTRYPEYRTYITFSEPNFKVRVGDFRTRLEATRLVQELRPIFHTLFVIPERINPPVQ
ncbi:SPOR domain-containing protein [Mucilaginibacter myungsuensis]|uniref:SPOR domain-containing protein n=1 Tax=Mucilaginibacter myungsuensis TaxID=649104 RepID=A0A929L0G7_9SPHI|nr:SPOR domain-containing protein [Mucilaginibacter myungsuensis]MBE9663853.1 SPOR domain-containing protein [Mucilaginibacter myungsuensis]MDN3598432.1 SPOR domain-containing protein [Mucilaginibacter myungsuensis]